MKHVHCMLINKAIHTHTQTHTQFVILIAFPLQTWQQERSCMCYCMYIDCLVYIFVPRRDWIDVAQNSFQQYAVKKNSSGPPFCIKHSKFNDSLSKFRVLE